MPCTAPHPAPRARDPGRTSAEGWLLSRVPEAPGRETPELSVGVSVLLWLRAEFHSPRVGGCAGGLSGGLGE